MKKGISRRGKYALIHGIINVLLPLLVIIVSLILRTFTTASDYNAWSYFYVAVFLVLAPLVSALAGTVISGIFLIKSSEKSVMIGFFLSVAGFAFQIILRFVLKF